jgi:hypothetical protein
VQVPDIFIIIGTITDRSYSAEPLIKRGGVGVEARSNSIGVLATIATEEVAYPTDGEVAGRGPYATVATLENCMDCGISSLTFY